MSHVISVSTEFNPDRPQRITKVVLSAPTIHWNGKTRSAMCQFPPNPSWPRKTRHITISSVLFLDYFGPGDNFIEMMAFPGSASRLFHKDYSGFGLDVVRIRTMDFDDPEVFATEKRMIKKLSRGCRRYWSV